MLKESKDNLVYNFVNFIQLFSVKCRKFAVK